MVGDVGVLVDALSVARFLVPSAAAADPGALRSLTLKRAARLRLQEHHKTAIYLHRRRHQLRLLDYT